MLALTSTFVFMVLQQHNLQHFLIQTAKATAKCGTMTPGFTPSLRIRFCPVKNSKTCKQQAGGWEKQLKNGKLHNFDLQVRRLCFLQAPQLTQVHNGSLTWRISPCWIPELCEEWGKWHSSGKGLFWWWTTYIVWFLTHQHI